MDSCASSLLTAYLYSVDSGLFDLKKNICANNASIVMPLLNMPRQDLNLRPDIKYLLNKAGIDSTSLPFLDDLSNFSPSELVKSKVFLVDHNRLMGPTRQIFGSRVIGIIDHHDDENAYDEEIRQFRNGSGGPKIVKRSGSCSSLVTNYWQAKIGPGVFENDKNLALLALGPLLSDTSSMKSKVEEPDTKAFELLKRSLGFSQDDVDQMYTTLDTYKKDVSSLTGQEILRKDYKEWSPEGNMITRSDKKNVVKGKFGISSVVKSIKWLYDAYDDFNHDMKVWGEERNLDTMVVMCSYKSPEDGSFCRDILFWSPCNTASEELQRVIKEVSEPLELHPMNVNPPGHEKIHFFHQHNTKYSRKQVAPLLKLHIQGVALNAL